MLTRDQILAVDDRQFEDVSVQEWGGSVRVGSMSALARDRYDEAVVARRDRGTDTQSLRAMLVAFAVVDEDGKPLFTIADIDALGTKSGAALTRVAQVVMRLNGMTDEAIEGAEKNSDSGQPDASPSA